MQETHDPRYHYELDEVIILEQANIIDKELPAL